MRKAKKIASGYRMTLEKNDRLGFIGSSVELPTVFADAKTPEKCYKATEEALMVAVATMLECGQRPPQPASARKRTVQVNVRLTSEEKLLLANAAMDLGFKGISDFIRNSALNRILTGQVAMTCHVAPRTVSKWFDTGQMKGYRIPGRKDRRIPVSELVQFMKAHNMPTDEPATDKIRVLIVDSDNDAAESLADSLRSKDDYEVQIAQSNFETGIIAQNFAPHVLLVNLSAKDINATEICKSIRADEDLQTIKIIAIAKQLSNSESSALLQKGFDDYICNLTDGTEVVKKIEKANAIIY